MILRLERRVEGKLCEVVEQDMGGTDIPRHLDNHNLMREMLWNASEDVTWTFSIRERW